MYFSTRSVEDLDFIFNSLSSSIFTYNVGFSEQLNKDLEEVIVTSVLMEKIENSPKTQTIISLSKQDEPKVKKKLFSNNIKVTIKGIGKSRTWPGRPELMKQYAKDPSIIERK